MGEIIVRKVRGMNWKAKIALVLMFTLVFSTFMYQGWYHPKGAQAATVTYNMFPTTATSVGVDGNTTIVAVTSYTSGIAGETNQNRAITNTTIPTGGTQGRIRASATFTRTKQESARVYGPTYGTATTISASATTRANVYLATAAAGTSLIADIFEYNNTTGFVGAAKGTGTAAITNNTNTQTMNITFNNASFAVASGNRVVVVYYFTSAGARPCLLFGAAQGTQMGYTTFTVTETAAPADSTPPTIGTVTVTPTGGTYTSSAPTITATMTDAESAVTACEYTTNGATWVAGVVSGASSPWTCTGSPTGLSGALTINVRGTSTGGLGTGVSVARTVDATAPTNGTITVTAGDTQNTISWTAATDAGSGLAATGTYILRFATGATAPANCTLGTAVAGSPFAVGTLSTPHTGLTNGTQYSYRLCAVDAVNNTSGGVTGSGTPATDPSKISSCAGCHGYTGAFSDGTARNTPAGLFQGSHNTHVQQYGKTCTVCHTVPATETSADFKHRDGTVNIASPINGAGTYSRTSFAQANSFTPGTCSNTYCHSNGTSVISGTIPANTSTTWGGTTACNSCHGGTDGRPNYTNNSPKRNTHGDGAGYGTTHLATACPTCHTGVAGTAGAYTISDTTTHNNGAYNLQAAMGYTQATGVCATASCHGGSVTWGGSLACIDCHSTTQGTRDAVVGEFGLAWGHKKSGRGAVTDADCIVCHLEGKYSAGVGSAVIKTTFHSGAPNGNIDLRDPDGAGETAITNISGTAFTFTKFATSYTAGSRTTNGHTSNTDIANVISQKFCLACHDSNGATNPTARSTAASTAVRPFNNLNLGANYTVLNGAATATGDLVNVKSQFATTNSSVHPILGPLNRDFPIATRLAVPYNGQAAGRVAAGGVKSLSVVMNCFDCHNTPTTPLTNRTVSAHGNAVTLRGTINVTTMTLCAVCHTGYTVSNNHGSGSAMAMSTGRSGEGFNSGCYSCHGNSGDTDGAVLPTTVRPINAQNYHGFNTLVGGVAKWPAAAGGKPYAFIRNTVTFAGTSAYHRPLRGIGELTTGSATCMGGSGCAGNGSAEPYTPGGQY